MSYDVLFLGLPEAFARLPGECRAMLGTHGRVVNLARGQTVIALGEADPSVVLVRRGLLALLHVATNEDRVVTQFLRPFELYLPAVYSGEASGCEVVSVGSSAAIVWPLPVFRDAIRLSPEFGTWVLHSMVVRERERNFQKARVAGLSLEAQYAYFLWAVSEADGPVPGSRLVQTKIPQQLVASYLGVAREEISRKKQVLELAGLLEPTADGLLLQPAMRSMFAMQSHAPAPWEESAPGTLDTVKLDRPS